MQATGSPTKILGAREENEQLFINQGTTIIEANSSDIDFPSQNPTAVTDWKTNDQASDVTLDQIKLLTRNQRVNVKGVLTLGELPPKELKKRNEEIGHVKEDYVIEDTLYTYGMKTLKNGRSYRVKNLSIKNYSGNTLLGTTPTTLFEEGDVTVPLDKIGTRTSGQCRENHLCE